MPESLSDMLADVERQALADALATCEGNQTKAAELLGISRRAVIYKMEKHGLKQKPISTRR